MSNNKSSRNRGMGGDRKHGRSRRQTIINNRDKAKADEPTRLILFNKPFNVLCQFTDRESDTGANIPETRRLTLADYIDEPGVYPAGRLDRDSEGLLLLTNNGRLQARISHPRHKLPKTYLVQVEGELSPRALQQLETGIELKDGPARALQADASEPPAWVWPRHPPVRFRKTVPDCWLSITIDEGRNRQVRRMTAAVGHPTLRLIRTGIGPWLLDDLAPGKCKAGDPLAIKHQ